MHRMVDYPWHGNVRELKNLIERIVVLKDGDSLRPEDLPENVRLHSDSRDRPRTKAAPEEGISFQTAVAEFEKALILSALERAGWVKNRAAELLQMKRTTLVEKIKRYHLEDRPEAKP
jgi:DNA-binding NtrC family response regulator